MSELLPCPFCGKTPNVYPKVLGDGGNCWGEVRCENYLCHVNPVCGDGLLINDERGSEKYKQVAIRKWNKRFAIDCRKERV